MQSMSAPKRTDLGVAHRLKASPGKATWRGLPGWTCLILDFPVGIRAVGIEVLDQVARNECASMFDAKQGAESPHPRTKLTPTRVGTCRRNSRSGEPL